MKQITILTLDQQSKVLESVYEDLGKLLLIAESSRTHVSILDRVQQVARSMQMDLMMREQAKMQEQMDRAQAEQEEVQRKAAEELKKQTEELQNGCSTNGACANECPDIQ